MADVNRPRRYYLHKRLEARVQCGGDDQLETVWQAKQEAEPGTPLPPTFPHLATLAPLGYTTTEDLDGADVCELERAGLSARDAEEVIAAISPL